MTTNHSLLETKLLAPAINPRDNPTSAILDNGRARTTASWRAIQRLTQAWFNVNAFPLAKGESAEVALHFRNHTTPASSNIDILEQGAVPILLSIGQMRNLHRTIANTPQCNKITCEAFGMRRPQVPVSGTGHDLDESINTRRCMCFQTIISERGKSNSKDHQINEAEPFDS